MKKRQEEEEIDYRDTLEYPYHLVKRENPDEFMYLNPDVPKPEGLPGILSKEIDRMIAHKKAGRYLHFEIEIEGLEGLTKNFHSVGEITDEQARQIFKMFGWPW